MPNVTRWMGDEPRALRRYLQEGADRRLSCRRGVIAASLIGIGAMGAVSLLQLGLVRRLPDPPAGNFCSRRVNSSDEAYSYGGPDAPIAITTHGVNMILASTGGGDRTERHPWLPILATLFAGAQAATAAKYLFHTMPKVDKAWCPYCILDALTHFATVAFTLPESRSVLRRLLSSR